jgi:DNA-binding NarL/FixJ family response regulator
MKKERSASMRIADPVAGRHRFLLVESDPWRRESLVSFLRTESFTEVSESPDIILVNLCRRSADVSASVEALKGAWPDASIVAFVTEVGPHTVFPCLLVGVKGILPFDAGRREIVAALRTVLTGSLWAPRQLLSGWIDRVLKDGLRGLTNSFGPAGGPGSIFTKSEWRILQALAEELSNKDIGKRLHVTEATVKFHIGKLLRKTGAKNRRGLARTYNEIAAGSKPDWPEAVPTASADGSPRLR